MGWEGLNRRSFPRANFPCLVKVRRDEDPGDVLLTHTENISTGGIGVIIKRQLSLYSELPLEIDLMDGEDVIVCRAKVMWVVRRKAIEAHKPSHYDTGLEFIALADHLRARIEKAVGHICRAR